MQNITVLDLKKRLDAGETPILIDVREPWEYEEFNINGKLIPLGDLLGVIADLEEYKNDEIIVHCRSGARSAAAQDFLAKKGFTNVRNLEGGMIAWQEM